MNEHMKNMPDSSHGLHPAFIENMRALLGDEIDSFIAALEDEPALALRVNPLRANSAAVSYDYSGESVPWEKNGFYLAANTRPGATIFHFSGAFYMQEASAMLPASILNARPGEKILDLCAAPGGKSSQIAAALNGQGVIVSNEPDLKRAKMLAGNIERLGIRNSIVVSEYPPKLAEKWPGFFDAVMVDAPCSGEGMFRRERDSRAQWQPASPEGCMGRQLEILDRAAVMLRPGGRMVYSTCTYNSYEDEGAVGKFLETHPDFSLQPFFVPGIGDCPSGMVKIWPHRVRGDGQFAALLIKEDMPSPAPVKNRREKQSGRPKADPAPEMYRRFISEFASPGENFRPAFLGDTLFAVPDCAPDTAGLRVISPGLALAKALKGRFEPDHRLAMALENLPSCELSGKNALAYCRGEEVPCDGKGWLAAKYMGLPLGWGKASGGVMKNHLPKGLRRNLEVK